MAGQCFEFDFDFDSSKGSVAKLSLQLQNAPEAYKFFQLTCSQPRGYDCRERQTHACESRSRGDILIPRVLSFSLSRSDVSIISKLQYPLEKPRAFELLKIGLINLRAISSKIRIHTLRILIPVSVKEKNYSKESEKNFFTQTLKVCIKML